MAQVGSKFQVGAKASQRPGAKVSARASSSPATRTPESDDAFWDEAVVSNKAAATPGGSGTKVRPFGLRIHPKFDIQL